MHNILVSFALLMGFLLMEGCSFPAPNNSTMSGKQHNPTRIIEYQFNDINLTRIDNTNTEKSFFFMGKYDTLVETSPEITIDWSLSHEMSGWILFDKNDSVAFIIQIGLGSRRKESSSLLLLDYEDYWQLNMADYYNSIWCIATCKGCNSCELVNYESTLTKKHFPNSIVSAKPINQLPDDAELSGLH